MLLRNYYYGVLGALGGSDKTTRWLTDTSGYRNTGWSTGALDSLADIGRYTGNISTSKGTTGMCFGTGRKKVTLDDYFLSGDIITDLSASFSRQLNFDSSNNLIEITILITATNGSSNNVVVGELGLIGHVNSSKYMVDRTLLDEPVTIPPGDIAKFTYNIKFTYPNPDE